MATARDGAATPEELAKAQRTLIKLAAAAAAFAAAFYFNPVFASLGALVIALGLASANWKKLSEVTYL